MSQVIGSTFGVRGGRWYGAGLILGRIGIKWIVAHRRNFLRCSPEHPRLATNEEKTVAQCDTNELLGIKNLLEKGQFPKGQFVDLVSQEKTTGARASRTACPAGCPSQNSRRISASVAGSRSTTGQCSRGVVSTTA